MIENRGVFFVLDVQSPELSTDVVPTHCCLKNGSRVGGPIQLVALNPSDAHWVTVNPVFFPSQSHNFSLD